MLATLDPSGMPLLGATLAGNGGFGVRISTNVAKNDPNPR